MTANEMNKTAPATTRNRALPNDFDESRDAAANASRIGRIDSDARIATVIISCPNPPVSRPAPRKPKQIAAADRKATKRPRFPMRSASSQIMEKPRTVIVKNVFIWALSPVVAFAIAMNAQ